MKVLIQNWNYLCDHREHWIIQMEEAVTLPQCGTGSSVMCLWTGQIWHCRSDTPGQGWDQGGQFTPLLPPASLPDHLWTPHHVGKWTSMLLLPLKEHCQRQTLVSSCAGMSIIRLNIHSSLLHQHQRSDLSATAAFYTQTRAPESWLSSTVYCEICCWMNSNHIYEHLLSLLILHLFWLQLFSASVPESAAHILEDTQIIKLLLLTVGQVTGN